MANRYNITTVARQLKARLNGKAFLTIPRIDVTEMLREVSGEEGTRIKAGIGAELEIALLEQGVRCFPGFVETTTGDMIRLFHAGTVYGNLVDMLRYPSPETDKEVAEMLTKIKGKWKWTTPTGPAALLEEKASES